MKLTNIHLQDPKHFDQFGSLGRKENISPLKSPGYFHHENSFAGGSSGVSEIEEGRLKSAINGLFHPTKGLFSSNSSWNNPLECTWYISESLKKYPTNTAIILINALPCYDNPNDLIVITLLGTLEEENLKLALVEGLKSQRIRFDTNAEKFAFKKLGGKIVPDLIKLIENERITEVRAHAYYVLRSLGKEASESVEVLANKAKNDPALPNRKLAAEALGAILADMNK